MLDRRKTTRRRTYFGGQIAFDRQMSAMDCLVRNISADGARLAVSQTAVLPQVFDLTMPKTEQTFRAQIVWRRADEAGVAFLEPRPQSAPVSLDLMRRLRQSEVDKALLERRIERLSGIE